MNKFNFKKKYGQNFLKDKNVINIIVDSINATADDLIIEIGPGGGALTKKLVNKKAQLIAFEIDKEAHIFLDQFESDKTTIIYDDFLKADLAKEVSKYKHDKLYIIGNLPYYITTAILEKIINSNIHPESITIMVQKEVAERFIAKPHNKEYGYMTVLLNYYYDIKKICDVSRFCFNPVPNVDSSVIQLFNKNTSYKLNFDDLNNILKEAFQFKRKKIINNIHSIDKDKIIEVLLNNGYSSEARAEELNLEAFIELAKIKESSNEEKR